MECGNGGFITGKTNILEHVMVPRHEILTKQEKKELLERLGVTEKKLPKILETDPVVKKIEAKPGDILRIKRVSPTAGESVYYRIVVSKKGSKQ